MQINPPSPRLRALRQDETVSFIPMEAIGENGGITLDQTRILDDVSGGYTEFQDGDVVVAKITPCFENGKAALANGLMNGAAFGTTELHVLRADSNLHRRFLFYVVLSDRFRKLGEAEMYGAGGQKRVPPDFCENYLMPLPSTGEQAHIAFFLDWKTGQIDALIARKQALLDRLKEKRLAVITHAVIRGLNPDAPLRDSGIPWIGHVPTHWDLCHLKRKFKSVEYGISEALDTEGDIAILRMGNIENGKIVLDDLKFIDVVATDLLLQRGDLLYNRTNSLELIGKVGMFIGACAIPVSFASYLVRIRVENDCVPEYFSYMLNTEGILGVARSNAFIAIGQCNLNPTRYGQISAAIPPKIEQIAIVCFLDEVTGRIDALANKALAVIAHLTEYRTTLISEATTGKMDLRNVQIPN